MRKTLVSLFIALVVVITIYLYLSGKASLFSTYPMDYTLETTSINGITKTDLITTVKANALNFEISFVDGAGNNDSSKLESFEREGKKVLRIQLHDTDFVRQKMLIGYKLKGSISKVSAGHYVLEIVNSDKKVLDSIELEVK